MKIINEKAIVIGLEKVDVEFLDRFQTLKIIGCPMTGLDHLPWNEINKRNIKVISLKDYPDFLKNITSTAEHTFGLILALMRNYKTALNASYSDREAYKGHTLSGKTLGIIGYGRVGQQVARIARGFDMKVLTTDKEAKPYHKLFYILPQCDVVSIHIPLENNEGFFIKEMFLGMKSTAYLINTSRDGVVENGALTFALQNNIIGGAGVDFIDDLELLEYSKTHDNLILTNHISGCTFEDMEKTSIFIENKVRQYLLDN